jgi:5-methyltetrahydrofolate--homocysteine methyltransferase
MKTRKTRMIKDILKERLLVLDGATGTLLQASGMPNGVSPELWCIENPEVISSIYNKYKDAGSDVVYTCTFGGNKYKLNQYDESVNIFEVNRKLAEIARLAVGDDCLVAGDIGPTGKFIEPFGDLSFEDTVECFKEQVRGLEAGGADLFVIETQMDIQEARAALLAVKEVTDKFVMVTMTYEADGRTLNGTSPVAALITLQSLGADAVGCNCSVGPEGMLEYVKQMAPYAKVPIVVKPNAGMPKIENGETVFEMDDESFASYAKAFVDAGVSIIGGCCGTTPKHINALKKALTGLKPAKSLYVSKGVVLSSARNVATISAENKFTVIGERINPTGKKALQKELLENKFAVVRTMARDQYNAGAALLDVNVGMPNIDEAKLLPEVVKVLSGFSPLPLVIDSSNPDAMANALRIYPGRALINSISLEKNRIDKMLPLAKKYGAAFVALPLSDDKIPRKAEERTDFVKKLVAKAKEIGLSENDMVVDALAMAVSADFTAGNVALDTIKWCSNNNLVTTLGLSNISFGLPQRKWVNSAFISLGIANGLTSAISNPCDEEFMNIKLASDLLLGKDDDAANYVKHFSSTVASSQRKADLGHLPIEQQIYQAIIDGIRKEVVPLVNAAVEQNFDIDILVNEYMIKAISKTGDLFAKQVYFLPQLIASAETMKAAFSIVEPLIKAKDVKASAGRVIMATVEGDIHDIGKNIVVLLLQNHGFEVLDLGKNISGEQVVEAIKEFKPDLVGLSALMTTTMIKMPEIIRHVHEALVNENISFMVGGAVVTPSFAESIGATYAPDGVAAVETAKKIINK